LLSPVAEEEANDNDDYYYYYYRQACKSIAEQIESSKNPLSIKQVLKVVSQNII
jgi:hypothetical protein